LHTGEYAFLEGHCGSPSLADFVSSE